MLKKQSRKLWMEEKKIFSEIVLERLRQFSKFFTSKLLKYLSIHVALIAQHGKSFQTLSNSDFQLLKPKTEKSRVMQRS